jgi:hypothetical protein
MVGYILVVDKEDVHLGLLKMVSDVERETRETIIKTGIIPIPLVR